MTFKETVAADLDIFVNIEEFGESVTLDGVKLRAVVVKNTGARQRTGTSNRDHMNPDLHSIPLIGNFLTIYFRTADYTGARERIPKYSEFINLDGKRYKVIESAENLGLTRLMCEIDSMNAPKMKLPGLYE